VLLREHNTVLEGTTEKGGRVKLRPLTEGDWPLLEKWNSDPEVLYYSEGDDVRSWSSDDVRRIYRSVSQHAYCFIVEYEGKPVGECWLQEMNLEEVKAKYPRLDVRRIDLMIGEKDHWGMGIGTTVVRLLTEFAFRNQGVDIIYIPGIADYNTRSINAFRKVGYKVVRKVKSRPGSKAQYWYDLALTREHFMEKSGGRAGVGPDGDELYS